MSQLFCSPGGLSDDSHFLSSSTTYYVLLPLVLTSRTHVSIYFSLDSPLRSKWAILECLTCDDLRSISLVSRALEDIASRLLFATLKQQTAEGSGAKILAVAQSAKLRSYVRHFKLYVFSPLPLTHQRASIHLIPLVAQSTGILGPDPDCLI